LEQGQIRNSGIIELLCGIVGKVPEFGLLTDEGRRAKWVIDLRTSNCQMHKYLEVPLE
jgi:predicted aconitase